jgi:hypothetical protein
VRWIVALGVGGLAACLLAPSIARAADPGYCNDYAHAAVDQTRFARSMPWCAPGTTGPRWSFDYRGHYDWCLGARFRDAQFERQARHDYIESCRHH